MGETVTTIVLGTSNEVRVARAFLLKVPLCKNTSSLTNLRINLLKNGCTYLLTYLLLYTTTMPSLLATETQDSCIFDSLVVLINVLVLLLMRHGAEAV